MIESRALYDYAATGVGSMDPGDDLDKRGFARTVLSDQAVDFAGIHRPIYSVEGDCATETLADILKLEKRDSGWNRCCHKICLIGEAGWEGEYGNRAPARRLARTRFP